MQTCDILTQEIKTHIWLYRLHSGTSTLTKKERKKEWEKNLVNADVRDLWSWRKSSIWLLLMLFICSGNESVPPDRQLPLTDRKPFLLVVTTVLQCFDKVTCEQCAALTGRTKSPDITMLFVVYSYSFSSWVEIYPTCLGQSEECLTSEASLLCSLLMSLSYHCSPTSCFKLSRTQSEIRACCRKLSWRGQKCLSLESLSESVNQNKTV